MRTQPNRPAILFASFLHFDVSFLCWVMIGALGTFIVKDLHLSATQKGLLVAVPTLSGSIARIVMGRIADSWSIKRTGYLTIIGAAGGLVLGATIAHGYAAMLGVGLLLGISGASFAVSLPMASRWFPPERQGLALGIAGAGNSGTVIAALFAPQIANQVGWRATMALALLPLAVTALVWAALAKDAPKASAPTRWSSVLPVRDFWLLALVYSVTFGGFVGLTTFGPIFLHDEYKLTAVVAGQITAAAAFAGSACRPLGGFIADRVGGRSTAVAVLLSVLLMSLMVGAHVSVPVTAVALVLLLASLGAGNGAVFQMVPQRFPREIALVTGLVGAAGGLGGFVLPTILGYFKDLTGSYFSGFAVFSLMTTGAIGILGLAGRRWVRTWLSEHAIVATAVQDNTEFAA